MNKLGLALCLLLCLAKLPAIEVVTNSYDKLTSVYLLIPFEQFIFSADSKTAHYQLSLNLMDEKKISVLQDVIDIKLSQQEIIVEAAYLQEVRIPQTQGNYKLVTRLKNIELGDKTEQQIDFATFTYDNNVKNILIADTGKFRFFPSAFTQLKPGLKSCYLVLDSSADYDSIMVKYQIDNIQHKDRVSIRDGNKFDVLPLLGKGNLTSLDLEYYSGNIITIPKWSLFVKANNYLQIFSLKDQLQQIRYIASQNEWKALRKVSEKDLSNTIERYWERHNSNPGEKNETRTLFYERVLEADKLFTIHKKLRGWKSDRGRIFIRYGQPDDIVEDSYYLGVYPDVRAYPHIRWYYYRANQVFNFIDKTGYGNYQIMDEYDEN
jgi:GWxTD domain-containing protein